MRMFWKKGKAGAGVAAALAIAAVLAGAGLAWGLGMPQEARHASHAESPAVRHPEVSGLRVVSREVVTPGAIAPDFRLVDRSGALVGLKDLGGKVVLLSFLYTNCPEACPLITGHYLTLQHRFHEAVEGGELALVLVTTDPEHDTPEHLQEYTLQRGGRWSFLTGDQVSLQGVWTAYGIHREVQERTREVVVYHSYKTYLIDGDGLIRYRYEGVWQPQDVARDMEALMGPA